MRSLPPPNVEPRSVGRLFHGIRADDFHWQEAWNISLAGTRIAVATVAAVEGYPSLGDVPMDQLRGHPQSFPATFLSPFGSTVFQGAMVRAGMRLGVGMPPYPTRWAPPSHNERVLQNADRELLIEEVRRRAAPHAASRLSCIWAAENTAEGRAWVERLVGRASFTFHVSITTATRVSRCDARWLETLRDGGDDAAAGYWSGQPCTANGALWEYLIEGAIKVVNEEDVQRIKAWALDNLPRPDA